MSNLLPLEVCRRVIAHLHPMYDNPVLAALARTCHALYPIASQRLYTSLYLLGTRPLVSVLNAFKARPILASHTRQLYIRPSDRERTPQSYWTHIADLLAAAGARLELLYIIAPDSCPNLTTSPSWVLRSLRTAEGHLTVLRVPFPWDTELATFMESTGARALTRLETGPAHAQAPTGLTLPATAAPGLAIIEAPPAALFLLVPGRPITHVRLRSGSAPLPTVQHLLADCLVHSTAPQGVIALDIGDLTMTHGQRMETYSLELIESAPRFVPHLRFLGIVNFPWTKDVPVTRLYKPLIRLTELRVLELVVGHITPIVDGYWELATASELRMFAPGLRELVFWKGWDRARWVWIEPERDWALAPGSEVYPNWGGV